MPPNGWQQRGLGGDRAHMAQMASNSSDGRALESTSPRQLIVARAGAVLTSRTVTGLAPGDQCALGGAQVLVTGRAAAKLGPRGSVWVFSDNAPHVPRQWPARDNA